MVEQPFEHLAYQNRFVKHLIQPLTGVDCFQESALLNPENNLITLKLSEAEFVKMYSSLLTGADICYPDESLQIVANFLKGIHCPPILVAHECVEYPPYAAFMQYPLQNPYLQPDFVPEGYLIPPMVVVTEENESEFPSNALGDIVVPFGALTLDGNWFEDISGQLPTITITVQGTGTVEVKLLNQVQGGLAIITLDNPPNLVDILAGIITGADNIIDVNMDIVSLPPETAVEHLYPVDIDTEGLHTIYIVFFPIIDDSLIPLRFGGGFRGAELCGFQEQPAMGITDIRADLEDSCAIQALENGVWVDKIDIWEMVSACVNPLTDTRFTNENRHLLLQQWAAQSDDWQTVGSFNYGEIEDLAQQGVDDAAAAAAAAAAAQSTANGAVTVNNTQNTRLTNLENRMTTAELDIDIAQADILNLFAIVGGAASQEAWAAEWDLLTSANGWTSPTANWVSGEGFVMNGAARIQYLGVTLFDNRVTHAKFDVRRENGGFGTMTVEYANSDGFAVVRMSGGGLLTNQWFKVPNNDNQPSNLDFLFSNFDGNVRLQKIKVLGRGFNLF